ncbi:MAG: MFS transporter [Candidatus Saccharimonas sp.]|nr:MFS transporter [Planctomycetaceae bacterium]
MSTSPLTPATATPLSTTGRSLILVCAFLGWLCAGMHMSITQLVGNPAAMDLLARTGQLDVAKYQALGKLAPKKGSEKVTTSELSAGDLAQWKQWKSLIARWFAWYQCAFLFGAATGGLLFGRLGDWIGRAKAMSLSILTYSVMAGAAYAAQSPEQLLVLWYLACTGVGGMWPNGVALVSEAWSGMSRPMVAGVIGTSANIGIFLFSTLATYVKITPGEWRWVMLVGACPLVLGLFSLIAVPESPRWLATRREDAVRRSTGGTNWEIFRPPLLKITLVGILLATIPIIGGWGTANFMIPWADEAGQAAIPPNPYLKAQVNQARAVTGIVGSLIGGWIASYVGRRRTYFLVSLACLFIAQFTFWNVIPTDRSFLYWVAALGFFSGIYFGWLPLFLPELFPTRVRSTGAGVSFNFGRIATAFTVFATGMLSEYFAGDYARIGRITSLFFALGMLAIFLAPDTSQKQLED